MTISQSEFLDALADLCSKRPDVRFIGANDGTVSVVFDDYGSWFDIGFAENLEELRRLSQILREVEEKKQL